MKKAIILLFLFLLSSASFAQENMKLIVNSSVIQTEKGLRKGPVVMVPLKTISDKIGAKLVYDLRDRRAKLMKKDITFIFYVGNRQITVNGEKVRTPFPAEIINEKVYVPISFFTDYFDCKARVDSKKSIIFINHSSGGKSTINDDANEIKDIDDFDI